jgi:hypothetical protein
MSPNCRREIPHTGSNNQRMVPILYRSVPDELIPEAVRKYQRIDFANERDFRSTFDVLVQALDTDLAWTDAHTHLLTRAKEWEQAAEDSSFLLRGNDLLTAQHWITNAAGHEPKPAPLHFRHISATAQASLNAELSEPAASPDSSLDEN